MGRWRYGVILDAGSSGTRIHVYRWLNSEIAKEESSEDAKQRLPVLETDKHWTRKIHPGISTFAETPEAVGTEHLASLYEHALEIVPPQDVPYTPLFLLATGGMRLLPDEEKANLLAAICRYSQDTTDFELPDCDLRIQVIPGDTEGLYGWIAANYLLGSFDYPDQHDHGKGHHTYGFLDMGGASAQIAFAPNETETFKHGEDLKLLRLRTVLGTQKEYRVFSATWLKYGVNEARRRYIDSLIARLGSGRQTELPDPCLPVGLLTNLDGLILDEIPFNDGTQPYLLGTGNFDECMNRTLPLLDKNTWCSDPPCSVQGKHVPPMDFDVNHFVGVSEYWHTLYELFERDFENTPYDYATYRQRITSFCSEPWMTISAEVEEEKWGNKIDEEFASEVCFKASWILNMLHEGIGIPRDFPILNNTSDGLNSSSSGFASLPGIITTPKHGYLDPFQAVQKIQDTEVSWTLGKMVLYAASQIPPLDSATLAVGFGSNRPGIPEDFQYASGLSEEINIAAPPPTYYPGRPNPDMPPDMDFDGPPTVEGTIDQYGNFVPSEQQAQGGAPPMAPPPPPEPYPDFSRRGPGFVLVFIMLVLIFFMLCGRERRHNFRRKFASLRADRPARASSATSTVRSKRRGVIARFLSILSGGRVGSDNSGTYERVESGLLMHEVDGSLYKPEDFELHDDDEDKGSKGLKENGGGMLTHGLGLGLGPVHAFDVTRFSATDRDRFPVAGESGRATGQRPSRNASPTRWRTPANGSVKEN